MKKHRYIISIAVLTSCLFIFTGIFAYHYWRPISKAAVLANVNKTYDSYFVPINNYLKDHELNLAPNHKRNPQDGGDVCHPNFSEEDLLYGIKPGERITMDCLKMDSIRPIKFDSAYQNTWQQVAPGLEKFLQSQGWHKEYSDQTAVADLFHHPKDNASFLSYVRNNHRIKCIITFDYDPQYPNQDQMSIGEDCRQVITLPASDFNKHPYQYH